MFSSDIFGKIDNILLSSCWLL